MSCLFLVLTIGFNKPRVEQEGSLTLLRFIFVVFEKIMSTFPPIIAFVLRNWSYFSKTRKGGSLRDMEKSKIETVYYPTCF